MKIMNEIHCWETQFKSCIYSEKLIDKILFLNSKLKVFVDINKIKKGIFYTRKYHGNQLRLSGEPFYSHPIEVALMLAEFAAYNAPQLYTANILQAAILHDTIEDTELSKEKITALFNQEVASHVEDLTRIKPYGKITAGENLRLLIKQKKYDTAIIKLFDRMHNLKTLDMKPPEKITHILTETVKVFLVFAEYLNVETINDQIRKIYRNYSN